MTTNNLADSAWGGASTGGFGSNYGGDYGGGPVKGGGYSARAQGPYGGMYFITGSWFLFIVTELRVFNLKVG